MLNKRIYFGIVLYLFFASQSVWALGEGLNSYCVYGSDVWHQKEDFGQYFCTIDSSTERDGRHVVIYESAAYGLSVVAYRFDYQTYFNTRSADQIKFITENVNRNSKIEMADFFKRMSMGELIEPFTELDKQSFTQTKYFDNELPRRYSAVKELQYTLKMGKHKGKNVTLIHERSTDDINVTLFGSYSVFLTDEYTKPESGYDYRFINTLSK